jgi:argininosuccinate synthase
LNTPLGPHAHTDGAEIRKAAIAMNVPLLTTLSPQQWRQVSAIQAMRKKELKYRSLQSHQGVRNESKSKPQVKKVVLAYSGGLDTSVIVPWLKENYGCEVVCFCADVGQGDEDMRGLEQKAINSGASQCIIHDMKEEFAAEYLFPMLKMGAVYEHKYLLGTSVARPLIAKHLVDVAHEVGADAIAHGATGKGNDQVRFELTVMALDPRLKIIAPWREWDIRSREDALELCGEA